MTQQYVIVGQCRFLCNPRNVEQDAAQTRLQSRLQYVQIIAADTTVHNKSTFNK